MVKQGTEKWHQRYLQAKYSFLLLKDYLIVQIMDADIKKIKTVHHGHWYHLCEYFEAQPFRVLN